MRAVRRPFLVLVVFALVLAACGDNYQTAIRVGDRSLSHREFADVIGYWTANPDFTAAALGPTDGTVAAPSQALVSAIAGLEINKMFVFELAEGAGISPDAALVTQARDGIAQQFVDPATGESTFELFPEEYQQSIGILQALNQQLQSADITEEDVASIDIFISERFGTYNPDSGQVVPPEGPALPASNFVFEG